MKNKKQYQIETAFHINGWSFVDISTPKFKDHVMICDNEDFYRWANDKDCGGILAVQSTTSTYPYAYMTYKKTKRKFFHRYAMPHLDFKKSQIDHKNRNGLDDRKANLRDGSGGVNARNRVISPLNNSGYRGVSWKMKNKKFCAQISVLGKVKHLGLFDTAEEASERYEVAFSRREHGLDLCEL